MIFHLPKELKPETHFSILIGKKKIKGVLIIFENFDSQKSAGRSHGQTQGIKKKTKPTTKKKTPSHSDFALAYMQQI